MEKKQHMRWTDAAHRCCSTRAARYSTANWAKYTNVVAFRIIAGAGGGGMNPLVLSGPHYHWNLLPLTLGVHPLLRLHRTWDERGTAKKLSVCRIICSEFPSTPRARSYFPCLRRNSATRSRSFGSFGSRSSEYCRRNSASSARADVTLHLCRLDGHRFSSPTALLLCHGALLQPNVLCRVYPGRSDRALPGRSPERFGVFRRHAGQNSHRQS
jgi:hypothetical protein